MKHFLIGAACLIGAGPALADGIDLAGQPVTLLFRDGNYVELGYTNWGPSIAGKDQFGNRTGKALNNLGFANAGFKIDLDDQWSAAVIFDQPWGADTFYPDGAFAFAGTRANVDTSEVTGLLRYKIDKNWSVHGGIRLSRFDVDITLDGRAFGNMGYHWTAEDDWGIGYVLGGAYEIPEKAIRVALTYSSKLDYSLEGRESAPGMGSRATTTDITMPRTVNLDMQMGLSPTTLLFGGIRWGDWKSWRVAPPMLEEITGGGALVNDDSDTWRFKVGLGHKLSKQLAVAAELSHVPAEHTPKGSLTPFDGSTSLALGATYTFENGVSVTGAAAQFWLHDADAREGGVYANFDGNTALGLNVNIGYKF